MAKKSQWITWAKQDEEEVNDLKEQAIERLRKSFEEAEELIQHRIDTFYAKYSEDGVVSPADARMRLSGVDLSRERELLARMQRQADEATATELGRIRAKKYLSRQEALLAEVRFYLSQLSNAKADTVDEVLREIAKSTQMHTWYHLEQGIGYELNLDRFSEYQIQALISTGADGHTIKAGLKYDTDKLQVAVNRLIPQQFITGASSQDLAKRLAKEMQTSYNSAIRLIRTNGTYVSAKADMETYHQAGCEQYEILATLDSRTSDICREMDGKVFPTSQAEVGVTLPPFHQNCRTTTLPVLDDMEDLNEERLAKGPDGKYVRVKKMTYREWEAQK